MFRELDIRVSNKVQQKETLKPTYKYPSKTAIAEKTAPASPSPSPVAGPCILSLSENATGHYRGGGGHVLVPDLATIMPVSAKQHRLLTSFVPAYDVSGSAR